MKKLKIRIQCKCKSCGKIWMDSRQWVYCMLCQADGTAEKKNMENKKRQDDALIGMTIQ